MLLDLKNLITSIPTWNKDDDFSLAAENLFYYHKSQFHPFLDLDICLDIVEKIFSNEYFLRILQECLNAKDRNLNNKDFLDSALQLRTVLEFLFLSPTLILEKFDNNEVEQFKIKFKNCLNKLNRNQRWFNYLDLFIFVINNKHLAGKSKLSSGVKILLFRLVKIISINLSYSQFLEYKFKEIVRNKKNRERFSWRVACSKIYYGLQQRDITLLGSLFDGNQTLARFNELFKDKNTEIAVFIIKKFLINFDCVESDLSGDDIITKVLNNPSTIRREIFKFCQKNLRAFSDKKENKNTEWSNKIFLITNKTLATFEVIRESEDIPWVRSVFLFELYKWIDEIYYILNKYEIEDDWMQIENYLQEENNKVEWKSSFLTSTESLYEGIQKEVERSKKILSLVAEAILGMINTEGGVILVGLIENPEKIKRQDVFRELINKNGITFFNIAYEFEKKGVSGVDDIKRRIQDSLFELTSASHEIFNNLWSIRPIIIKKGDDQIVIYKIVVFPAEKLIFCHDKEKQSIHLIKRANGRTIKVSPLDYLRKAGLAM